MREWENVSNAGGKKEKRKKDFFRPRVLLGYPPVRINSSSDSHERILNFPPLRESLVGGGRRVLGSYSRGK